MDTQAQKTRIYTLIGLLEMVEFHVECFQFILFTRIEIIFFVFFL